MLVSIGMVQHHRERWSAHQSVEQSSAEDSQQDILAYYRKQFIRRTSASILIGLVGGLLIADYFVVELTPSVIIIMLVMILLLPIFGLGLWDAFAGQIQYRSEMSDVHHARQAMHEEARRLMEQKHRRKQSKREEQESTEEKSD